MQSVAISAALPAVLQLPARNVIQHPLQLDRLLAGALVFRVQDSQLQVLLVRRAASDSSPGKWERPGGCFDAADESILACAVRELHEETGLHATRIHCCVGLSTVDRQGNCDWGSTLEVEQPVVQDNGLTVVQWDGQTWATLTLLVDVAEDLADERSIQLVDTEHDLWTWVSEAEVLAFEGGHGKMDYISEGVWRTVLEGFRLRRAMIEQPSW